MEQAPGMAIGASARGSGNATPAGSGGDEQPAPAPGAAAPPGPGTTTPPAPGAVPPPRPGEAAPLEPGAVPLPRPGEAAPLEPGAVPLPRPGEAAPLEPGALPGVARRRPAAGAGRWPFQLVLLLCYLAAGVLLSWPRASYLTGRLPGELDQSSYVWDFWWIAHQVTHLGNPWFTAQLAAPAGSDLGFDTLMPLPGLVMTPVTLAFGPSVSYNLLAIVIPGLTCYLGYRAARLWLSTALGAVAAGAFYGFAAMMVWQDWYHMNIALGALFFPLVLEASVRLRRRPGWRPAVRLGVLLGAAFLVNQETTIMAALLAAAVLIGWLARTRSAAALGQTALAAGVAVLVASPQIVAMVQQALAGGAALPASLIAHQDTRYGVPLDTLFAPSPRIGQYGLHALAAAYRYQTPKEGIPTFGVMLTLLALTGLIAAWRRPVARLSGLAWLACAVIALGSQLRIGRERFVPLAVTTHQVRMSALLPYTWLIHIPGLSGLREPDRFLLLGLLPAALLAGFGVEWLRRRAATVLIVALTLAALEAGYSGSPLIKTMATAKPSLDAPIAADHSGSIVVDVPFGLGGGLGTYGGQVSPHSLVLATEDGHPRAVSDSSWEPATTVRAIRAHPFYRDLVTAEEHDQAGLLTAEQLRAARRDALRMRVGWAIVWKPATAGQAVPYLQRVGFTFVREVGSAELFRLAPAAGGRR